MQKEIAARYEALWVTSKLRAGKNTFFKPRCYIVYSITYNIKTFYASEHILFTGFLVLLTRVYP